MKRIMFLAVVLFMFFFSLLQCSAQSSWMENKDYWDNGNVRSVKRYDSEGDIKLEKYYREDGTLEQYIEYDDEGHKIAEAYYGENGDLREGPDGWAAMRFKYEGGNMVAEGYYGPSGKLTERKLYNSEGDLVAKQYYGDKERLPAEEYNPDPPLAGEQNEYYDEYGRPEGTTSVEYDEDIFSPFWDYEE
ncbi:MAG: hypothetical protein GF409_00445 [Candidatus Omnitrophica bacterium]|nr:hypothetical protein [Candidatus Omnitrophota bacterium]